MDQLGSTLKRLVAIIADKYKMEFPFLFSKLDIAYSFWRLVVSHLQAWNFCYVLPASNVWPFSLGDTYLVVLMELKKVLQYTR